MGFVIVLKSYIVNKIVFPSFYDAVMKLISQHIAVSPDEVQRAVNILTQLIMKDFNFKTWEFYLDKCQGFLLVL